MTIKDSKDEFLAYLKKPMMSSEKPLSCPTCVIPPKKLKP